ncbi:MAG: 2-succinyl-5-enolpyruvyl-6-hydroxy-3-cyclohexene-1-carboxylic-acid synthase [Dehalococcoidia bacterium]|nr:2-succinyl-5-enolpyruvyl-6-hydroxy-3-cyclohexene-1-carboxylic-acid synthase [Dehalococcoidia bacterium]
MAGEKERYVRGFVAQLARSGVTHAVICPGSRSTPLTLALAAAPDVECLLHLDERSAGYFALGLARQLGEPVALVCTSGTAAANFLPAVVEASLSRVPLVVLTADRPPELRDVGAAQTIDQVRMFGSHARWAVEMPLADGSAAVERYAVSVATRAVEAASSVPAGPVQLNFPFREPLIEPSSPAGSSGEQPFSGTFEAATVKQVSSGSVDVPAATAERLAGAFAGRRGVVVCGPQSGGLPAAQIAALASALGWPLLADPLSGLRAGKHDRSAVVETYDTLLRDQQFGAETAPEVVLRFGAAPTSKATNGWLAAQSSAQHVLVDEAQWRDPDSMATEVVRAEPALLSHALLAKLGERSDRPDAGWGERWRTANEAARDALREAIDGLQEPFEGRAPLELVEALPEGATLVAGNSMPVRDIDSFLPSLDCEIRIVGTRGASGIDGVVSTAVGAAAGVKGSGGPEGAGRVALLVGDLSFFHDLNGLWPLRRHGLDLTVLLVNNDGGGIFHFLSQVEQVPDHFEQWFGTPHRLDFEGAVRMHGGSFTRLEGAAGWRAPLAEALAAPGLSVLELRTDRERNVELHQRVIEQANAAVRAALRSVGAKG